MADIRLQSEKSLTDFFCAITLCRPSFADWSPGSHRRSFARSDWAVTDLDLSLRNMTFSKDDWQTQEGKLSMNAQRVYLWLAAFI